MEQTEGFWQTNRNYLIGGVIVVIAIILFVVQANKDNNDQTEDQQTAEQNTNTQNGSVNGNDTDSSNPSNQNQNGQTSSNFTSGNVSAVGLLRVSDNTARGNLMVESNRGKIYIKTSRDFSSLVGKSVTMNAEGSLNSFKFLGFNESVTPTPADQPDVGGSNEGLVQVSGKLEKSGSVEKGDYTIASNQGIIYLKTVHNYDTWIGSDVDLKANGTIQSFTNAVVTKK